MGLPVIIDIPNTRDLLVFEKCFDRLRQIDQRFSLYKPDSETSRYRRGEVDPPSRELAKVIKECKAAGKETDGYFSAWAGGAFDPSGYVKGWAIDEAGKLIQKAGFGTFCIAAGGDIMARSDGQKIWKIGIQNPLASGKILDLLSISNGAVATSGNYERGLHIINPKTKQPADELLSVTVIGPDIIKADVLATAIFAKGQHYKDMAELTAGYGVLVVDKSSKIYKSPSYRSLESSR